MKRFAAFLLLALYLYNFFGYLAAFSLLQQRVRHEVRRTLEARVPESELVTIVAPPSSPGGHSPAIQWIKEREFRYRGGLYDVVRSFSRNDSVFYLCLNDVKEERVLAGLEDHVRRHMDGPQQKALAAFADVFKDSLPLRIVFLPLLSGEDRFADLLADGYESVVPEIPSPPPRILPFIA